MYYRKGKLGIGGEMMDKKDSLNFLQGCIDRIANATEKDIEMFRMKYDIHCMEPLASSEFKFISPTDLESLQAENVEEIKLTISENYRLDSKDKVRMHYFLGGNDIKNSQGNDNAAFAA